jgi:nucleoside-diphosphate-sugar epimerase
MATTSPKTILLLGGHGRVALYLTPLLLSRSHNVASIIRNPSHTSEIEALGAGKPGKVSVLVDSLDEVKEESDAQRVLEKVRPDWVVWAAGAGGKGGKERTKAVDEVAAKAVGAPSFSLQGWGCRRRGSNPADMVMGAS